MDNLDFLINLFHNDPSNKVTETSSPDAHVPGMSAPDVPAAPDAETDK